MQLATLFSDLSTLFVTFSTSTSSSAPSNPQPALRLVSAATHSLSDSTDDRDSDLQRANNLLALHQNVKLAYSTQNTQSKDILALRDARRDVAKAVESLGLTAGVSTAQQKEADNGANNEKGDVLENNAQEDAYQDDDELEAWS